ncbi:MAG TPA: hypothetical protein VIM11_10150 [Tepidisphaeraceae bacterium]
MTASRAAYRVTASSQLDNGTSPPNRCALRARTRNAACAYDLTANTSGICPECGSPTLPIPTSTLES